MPVLKNKILSYLLKKRVNFWEIVPRMGYIVDFVKVLKKMEKENLIKIRNSYLSLTPKGRKTAFFLKITPQTPPLFSPYEIKIDERILKKYKNFRKNKVFIKDEFDQLQITEEGIIKKIEIMRRFDDLENKRIICLGDDDLVGIALALTKKPKKITVLDVDREIVNYENQILNKLGYKNAAFFCDFLKPIPKRFKGQYDIFITEPPDTVAGINLFFSRGIDCLNKKGGIAYLGVCKNNLKDKEFLEIEKNILKTNSLITDIFSYFQEYTPSKHDLEWVLGLPKGIDSPKISWFFSDLLRIKILEGAKPLIKERKGENFRKKYIYATITID